MRLSTFIFSLALCLSSTVRAENANLSAAHGDAAGEPKDIRAPAPGGGAFVIGLSPFLDTSSKDTVFRGLVRLIVEDLPLNSTLEVYDAFNLKSITRVSIPGAKVFNSPKTRANQFAPSIGEIRQFLARDNPKPSGPPPGFDAAIRLPQFCDFLDENRPSLGESTKVSLLLIGSPLYQDAREPAFSMTDGYFPSDGHLRVSREQSIFGFNSQNAPPETMQTYWAYFGDPWMSDLHRQKVERFWSLYIERRGGRLASFSSDLATAMSAFASQAPGRSAASNGWVADSRETEPEMLRAGRNIELVDWLTGDSLPDAGPPPPLRWTGPIKIGIRWKDKVDLDLYAAPRRDGETLFFQHPRSPQGYYFKDHRSSPGHEYEFIEFESPVDVRQVRAFVNFYEGSCPGGARGEVRVEFLNRIYHGSFSIASSEGNQGRSGPSQTAFWARIPVQEILRVNEMAPQAVNTTQ